MIELPRKFIQKVVNDRLTTATRQAIRYIRYRQTNFQNFVISHTPPSILYQYFKILAKFPNRSDSHPLNPIWVNPDQIIHYHGGYLGRGFGVVVDGGWDKQNRPFKQNIVYRSIKDRYVYESPWDETELYNVYEKLSCGESLYGREFRNEEQLHIYFNQIDKLYESISENGYKTQRELLEDGKSIKDPASDSPHTLLNEVVVVIYRDGSFAKYSSGNHRLSIAKVHPSVKRIPVIVKARHAEWQQIRDEVRNSNSYNDLSLRAKKHLNHPDIKDIAPKKWINKR